MSFVDHMNGDAPEIDSFYRRCYQALSSPCFLRRKPGNEATLPAPIFVYVCTVRTTGHRESFHSNPCLHVRWSEHFFSMASCTNCTDIDKDWSEHFFSLFLTFSLWPVVRTVQILVYYVCTVHRTGHSKKGFKASQFSLKCRRTTCFGYKSILKMVTKQV